MFSLTHGDDISAAEEIRNPIVYELTDEQKLYGGIKLTISRLNH